MFLVLHLKDSYKRGSIIQVPSSFFSLKIYEGTPIPEDFFGTRK
jgi:hypothetical protein